MKLSSEDLTPLLEKNQQEVERLLKSLELTLQDLAQKEEKSKNLPGDQNTKNRHHV